MEALKQCTDLELVTRVKKNDEAAKQEIYLRYYSKVEKLCAYCLKSQEDGQDAAQDVFMHILIQNKINSFRGESKLWSWIRRVAINKCNELFRKRKRLQGIQLIHLDKYPGLSESIPAKTKSPEDLFQQCEETNQIKDLMPQLPTVYQNAVQQIVFQDKTYSEASDQLGIPVRAVGVHLHRAKQMLMKLVQDKWMMPNNILVASEKQILQMG